MHAYSRFVQQIDNESEIEIVRHRTTRVSPIGKIEWSSAIQYPSICALHVDDRWAYEPMKKLFSSEYQSVCVSHAHNNQP